MSKQLEYNVNRYETKGRFFKALLEWYIKKPELLRKRREQFLKS